MNAPDRVRQEAEREDEVTYPMNPYYDSEKLGLVMESWDEPNMSYEFNTFCLWATQDGRVFRASDSGCSCPTPFQGYCGSTRDAVLQTLEQVGSEEQATRAFDAWRTTTDWEGKPTMFLSMSDREDVAAFVRKHLKNGSKP